MQYNGDGWSTIKKCGSGGGSGITKEVTGTTQVNILTEFFCTSSPYPLGIVNVFNGGGF